MRFKTIVPALTLALLIGCNSTPKKTSKQQMVDQWNHARANVMFGLARDQYSTGNFDPARKSVQDGLALDPQNEPLHVLAAKLAIEGGQLDRAARELEQARKINPKDAEADYLSGVVA